MFKKVTATAAACCLVIGCAGRDANPVPSYRPGDDDLTCREIESEQAYINEQINELVPESKKTGKNVALGAAGLFLIFPWFFMDLSDAEKTEIRAYQNRYAALDSLSSRRGCEPGGVEPSVSPEQSDDIAARLDALDKLLEDGAITEEEHAARRRAILDEI